MFLRYCSGIGLESDSEVVVKGFSWIVMKWLGLDLDSALGLKGLIYVVL